MKTLLIIAMIWTAFLPSPVHFLTCLNEAAVSIPKNNSTEQREAPAQTLKGHSSWVSVAFSRDGRILSSGSQDKTIKLWDMPSGNEIRTLIGHTGNVKVVAFSPDDKILASGSTDNSIKLWEVATGKLLRDIKGYFSIYNLVFSPDGRLLAYRDDETTIKLLDVETGKLSIELIPTFITK
jgi:WD40 repeat protein